MRKMCVQVNANRTLTAGLRLGYVFGEDDKCTDIGAVNTMSHLLASNKIAAVVGGVKLDCFVVLLLCCACTEIAFFAVYAGLLRWL